MAPAWRQNAPLYLAGGAAVATVVSIAAFELLLGLAFVWLLYERRLRRFPLMWPVLAWAGWTVLALAFSGHARAGFPQVKQLYVYLMLPVVYCAVSSVKEVRAIAWGWVAAGALSALWGLEQFARKVHQARAAHTDFYQFYVASRITGFMGHWMTFSGHMMMALMITGAMLLFLRPRRGALWLALAGILISIALIAAETRSAWMGAAAGGVYLLWFGRRWLIIALPVIAAIVLLVNPFELRDRAISIVHPHADDSNAFRALTRRVGWQMIKAHPLLGVGPEQVSPQFKSYVPADVPRPLPSSGYYGHLDNIYFQYAADRGLPGLLALMWIVLGAGFDFAKALARQTLKEGRWVLHGALASIIGILLSGYFELNLGDSEVLGMFLAILACGYVALKCGRSTSEVP